MKHLAFIFLIFSQFSLAQEKEHLLTSTFSVQTNQLQKSINTLTNNLKMIPENFDIKLDSSTKVKKAKEVAGTLTEPVFKITVQKCVFIFCQSVDFDGLFSLETTSGKCDYNYKLNIDLRRSGQMLTDLYSDVESEICVQSKSESNYTMNVNVYLIHSPNYQSGIVQREALKFINLQSEPIITSIKKVLNLVGAKTMTYDVKLINAVVEE